jgi:hypothetical protein
MASIPLLLPKATHPDTRWINQVYSERAEAIRELKTWVVLPLDCTSADLEKKLKTLLITITDGNWGALEQRPLPTAPELPFWQRIAEIGRKIFIAVFPLTAFAVGTRFFPMDPQLQGAILNLVIAWTCLSLLALLDPGFAAKLSSFKDVKDVLGARRDDKASANTK